MTFVSTKDLLDLTGKSALVTGAARGIGQAIARRLADAGASVVICDLDRSACAETLEMIQGAGGTATIVEADVSSSAQIDRLIKSSEDAFGGIDILVNNAALRGWATWDKITEEDWDRFMAVNLRGVFFLSQRVAHLMIERKRGGSIVNIASTAAAHPVPRKTDYNTAKAGVAMMTKSLAVELGPHGIRVNAVGPGGTRTPGSTGQTGMTPEQLKKLGEAWFSRVPLSDEPADPDDIARAVLFLSSQAAQYVTAQVLYVDGGYLAG